MGASVYLGAATVAVGGTAVGAAVGGTAVGAAEDDEEEAGGTEVGGTDVGAVVGGGGTGVAVGAGAQEATTAPTAIVDNRRKSRRVIWRFMFFFPPLEIDADCFTLNTLVFVE